MRARAPECVLVCVLRVQECGKGHKTIPALLRERGAGSRLTSGAAQTLREGERQFDVIRVAYPEPGQALHLTDALSTLGIHKRGGSREGQPDVFNYIPKNDRPSYLRG